MSPVCKQKKLILRQLRKELKTYQASSNTRMVIRIKVIIAYEDGRNLDKIHQYYDMSSKTVKRWVKQYLKSGVAGLEDKPRSGRPPKIDIEQLKEVKEIIRTDKERAWVARHVYVLIITMLSVCYSVKYIPELLKKVGLSFHKAVHYLIKRNEEKRSKWIKEKLPEIYADHIKNGWRIFFQDEVGFQTEGTLSYSWGLKGEPIVVNNKGRHGRVNMIGVYEVGSGEVFYKFTNFKVTALRFKRFLCSLKRKFKTDKFIVIADNASFHKAKWLSGWKESIDWLKIEFLPAYSPDFNPIERLWKWIKKEYTHNKCWSSKVELRRYLEKKMLEMTSDASQYIGTMNQELLRLKAACDHHKVEFPWQQHLSKAA